MNSRDADAKAKEMWGATGFAVSAWKWYSVGAHNRSYGAGESFEAAFARALRKPPQNASAEKRKKFA